MATSHATDDRSYRIRLTLLVRVLFAFAVIFIPAFLLFGYATQKVLERHIRMNTNKAMESFAITEGQELDSYFKDLSAIGPASAAYLTKRLRMEPVIRSDFDQRYTFQDGALRTNLDWHHDTDIPGMFASSRATITPELKREITLSGLEFSGYAKGVSTTVFNTYYISKNQFLRIYPKDWALEIEPDHDFTQDLFYYVADPEHNPDRTPQWTPAYYDAIWKHWMTSLITPVYVNDEFRGVVGHDVILDQIYDDILAKVYFTRGYGFLFDDNGRVVLHPEHLDRLREVALMGEELSFAEVGSPGLQAVIGKFIANKPSDQLHRITFQDGDDLFHAYIYPMRFLGWNYGIVIPESELMSVLPAFRFWFAISALSIWLLLFTATLIVVWYAVVRPVRRIAEVTRTIGEGQFDVKVQHRSSDEIGDLAQAVNGMATNLKSKTSELTRTNENLRREVKQRIQALNALKLSEQRFRQLFEQSPDGVYVRVGNRFVVVNPGMEQIFGYSMNELASEDFDIPALVPEEHQEAMRNQMKTIEEGRFPSSAEAFSIRRKDGETREVEIKLTRIEWEGDTAVLGFVRDMTEQKNLEAQLQHSQRMEAIGKLAGGVAHDFNNLLTAITGNAEIALMKLEQEHVARAYVKEIDITSERAAALTRQLLAFSRKQVIRPRSVNLNDALANMREMLHRVIGEDIGLQFIHAQDLWQVEADPSQLEQVVMNLAVNSRDAMPRGGKLTIETANVDLDMEYSREHLGATPGKYVQLSVSDTGCGMSKEVRDHIFEPFYTTKEESKGTGLGLATVYGIIKQNHGFINVYSEVNVGSTFRIYLPQFTGEEIEFAEEELLDIDPRGKETVFVVEDETAVREMARRILEQYDYKVLVASHPEEAVALYKKKHTEIDVILSDVIMPKMTGPMMIDEMLKINPNLKVVYMSGHTENAIVEHGVLRAGIQFIAKPFRPIDLAIKIRMELDRLSTSEGTSRGGSQPDKNGESQHD